MKPITLHKTFAFIACCVTIPVLAFDAVEHERVSDHAFKLALEYFLYKHCELARIDDAYDRDVLQAVKSLIHRDDNGQTDDGDEPKGITYGQLVRVVDELLYPRQIFVTEKPQITEANPNHSLNYVPKSHEDLNPRYRNRGSAPSFGRRALDLARALANNETHFQNAMMRQYIELQQDAFEAAKRSKGELYFALVNKALSDHFLQDFFAPGHVLWPRENSHDNIALATHDATNHEGAYMAIQEDAWKLIRPLAKFVAESDDLDRLWLRPRKLDSQLIGCEKSITTLREAVECLADGNLSEGTPPIVRVYGDGELTKSPRQQAYLMLVQAFTTWQVLEIHYRKHVLQGSSAKELPDERKFRHAQWSGSFEENVEIDAPQEPLRAPVAALWFGSYEFKAQDEVGLDEDPFKKRASSLILVNVGGQTPIRSIGSSRLIGSIEYAPLGLFARSKWARDLIIQRPSIECELLCNTGVLLGAHIVRDEKFDAKGLGLRFVKVFPAIDFQTSVYVNRLRYDHVETEYKTSFGLRVDLGFSAGSFFLKYGKEQFLNERNELQGTGMFSAGIGIGMPISRINKWWKNKSYKPREY